MKLGTLTKWIDFEYIKKWGFFILIIFIIISEAVIILRLNKDYKWFSRKIVKYNRLLNDKKRELNRLESELARLSIFKRRIKSFSSEALAFAYVQSKLSELAKDVGVDLRRVSISKTALLKLDIYGTYISVYLNGSPYSVLKFLSNVENMTNNDAFVIERCTIRVVAFRNPRKNYKFSMRSNFLIKVVWFKKEESGEG